MAIETTSLDTWDIVTLVAYFIIVMAVGITVSLAFSHVVEYCI